MSQQIVHPLVVQSVERRFAENVALSNASFELRSQEILALLGPNGAGKTTLIRSIAGRLKTDGGQIMIEGVKQVPGGCPDVAEKLGVIPQDIALYEALTATENLALFARLYGVDSFDVKSRTDWALEWTGLKDRAKEPVKNFSGGMQRRLNIACGVLHRPTVILLDEPTVGVDPQSRERIRDMLSALRSDGASIVLTTHQLDEAQMLSDRIVIIDHGKTIAAGTMEELVAASVGSDRRFVATVEQVPDQLPQNFEPYGPSAVACRITDVTKGLTNAMQALNDAGISVTDVAIESPDLQSVFLHYTGRDLRE